MKRRIICINDTDKGQRIADQTNKDFAYRENETEEKLDIIHDPNLLKINSFKDGEIQPLLTDSVRGDHIYLIQSTQPPAENLLKLIFTIRALKRNGAKTVNVIIPYFAYARQDRMGNERTSVTAKDVMDMLSMAGADRLLTIDLHAFQIQGFTNVPHDHIMGISVFKDYFRQNYNDSIICSPDAGGMKRAEMFATDDRPIVMMSKTRNKPNEVATMTFVGNKDIIKGKKVVIIDDIIDTGGTLVKAADYLMDLGAGSVSAFITHGVLSGPARERIENAYKRGFKELIISDSIQRPDGYKMPHNINVVSCENIISKAIQSVILDMSIKRINTL